MANEYMNWRPVGIARQGVGILLAVILGVGLASEGISYLSKRHGEHLQRISENPAYRNAIEEEKHERVERDKKTLDVFTKWAYFVR